MRVIVFEATETGTILSIGEWVCDHINKRYINMLDGKSIG